MKIAFVLAHLSRNSGGLAHSISGLAEGCRNQGASTIVIGIRDPAAPGDAERWNGVVSACRSFGPRGFAWAPGLSTALAQSNAELADTQHLWMYPSLAVSRWARAKGRRFVVTPRGMLDPWALRRSAWKKRVALWCFEQRHLEDAACIRALNRAELAAVRAFGLRNPVAVVPNGVDLPEHLPDRALRGERCLLFLGRIDPKKGVHELLRGWHLSGAARQGWRLRIVGWGEAAYVEATRRLLAELELDDSVELAEPAFSEAKDRAFREADAFVLPSYSEGLPMAVLEAWSYALPVLLTPACNLPEGFERGAALEIGTEPERIAEGIGALVGMADREREAMGAKGRALVEDRFTWPEAARRMIEVYRWVLGGGSPPACVVTD